MRFSKAEHIVILACIIGLCIMLVYINTYSDFLIYMLLVPAAMFVYARRVNDKEIRELEKEEKK